MRHHVLLISVMLSLATGCREAPKAANGDTAPDKTLQEAREAFTHQGEPILPYFLNDFAGGPGAPDYWKVGMGHRITTVAVGGLRDAPPYVLLKTRRIGGFYAFDYPDDPLSKEARGAYYGYRFLGTTPGGTTVLEYVLSTGGSAVCSGVLLVRFEIQQVGLAKSGTKKRLVMRFVSEMWWGDRVDRTVRLEGDKLLLGPATASLPGYQNPVEPARTVVID